MLVVLRLFKFYRRSGMSIINALKRALYTAFRGY
jgi:hypothetical protein